MSERRDHVFSLAEPLRDGRALVGEAVHREDGVYVEVRTAGCSRSVRGARALKHQGGRGVLHCARGLWSITGILDVKLNYLLKIIEPLWVRQNKVMPIYPICISVPSPPQPAVV